MVRVFPACLFAALTLGCAPDLNWRDWRSDESKLTLMFPCKPVRQQRRVQLGGRELTLVLQVCDSAGVTWAQLHTDVKDPVAVGPVLRALTESAHANISAARATAAVQVVPGATPQPDAGRFQAQGQLADGRPVEMVALLFAHGTLAFQSTALGTKLPEDAVQMFLGSVRLDR